MVKKYNVDKDIIQKLTKAVKELTNTLKKNNLKKNTFEKVGINEPKRVKVDYPGALVSPMVGTVYLSPEPGKKTYIKKGQLIKKGEILLIIEAMKTFNEIKAPKSGVIKTIVVLNNQPVEFGEPLVIFE